MTEANNGANKAKTAKIRLPVWDAGLRHAKIGNAAIRPAEHGNAGTFRDMAEKGVAQAKVNYEKIQSAAEGARDLLNSAYSTAARGTADYNRKVIEIAAINAHAAIDYAHELLGVKSPSEFMELSTAHARKQFEAMAAQTKETTEPAQKVTTEIAAKDWRHGDTKSIRCLILHRSTSHCIRGALLFPCI